MSNDPQSIREARVKRALKFISGLESQKAKVLDIGCQSGGFCAELLQLGHDPSGIEIVPALVENAKRRHPTIPFVVGNCEEEIPFSDGFFDVVWAGEVIEHIRHTDMFINEINRVLRPGGFVVLTTPMHNRIKNLYVVLFRFEKHFDPEFPHYRFYSRRSLTEVLNKRGFEVTEVDYIGRIPIVANAIFIAAKKVATKTALSHDRF